VTLTPEQMKLRQGKLTGSQVGTLIRGDEEQIYNLWRLVSGDPAAVESDFSDNWPVQLGVISEELNLKWYTKKHGPVTRQGEVVTHENGWAACTLDGWDVDNDIPIQCKHVIQYKNIDDVIDFYSPQHHWEMFVTRRKRIASSVIIGALEPAVNFVAYDDAYGDALYKRALAFMECVWSLTPPVMLPALSDPVRPEAFKTVDMTSNNSWASIAADWLQNKDGAKKFEDAKKSIKEMMAPDTGTAYGHGITAKKSKDGSVRIREGEPKNGK
jgi:YqaJ-like viral recombinase domain